MLCFPLVFWVMKFSPSRAPLISAKQPFCFSSSLLFFCSLPPKKVMAKIEELHALVCGLFHEYFPYFEVLNLCFVPTKQPHSESHDACVE